MKYSLVILSFSILILFSCKKGEENDNSSLKCSNSITYSPANFTEQDSATIFIPTAFTPDGIGDNMNDRFWAVGTGLSKFKITVFSNGQTVYQSTDINEGWDGKVNGSIENGQYSYEISATNMVNKEIQIFGTLLSIPSNTAVDNCKDCLFADQIRPGLGFLLPTNEPLKCN